MSKSTIRIDRTKETIAVSRAFQIAAGNIGSAEYQEFLRMKEQYCILCQIAIPQQPGAKTDQRGAVSLDQERRMLLAGADQSWMAIHHSYRLTVPSFQGLCNHCFTMCSSPSSIS